MIHNNKFEDKQKVKLFDTGEVVTINRWSYAPSMKRYTYSVEEYPSTFYFEDDLVNAEE
jgi:hypothetical protein